VRRLLLKKHLRKIITEVLSDEPPVEQHRCISGEAVSLDTPECVTDLQYRIEDAAADRDACSVRTDARVHYNGLLRVLRRKLRKAQKLQPVIEVFDD